MGNSEIKKANYIFISDGCEAYATQNASYNQAICMGRRTLQIASIIPRCNGVIFAGSQVE